MRKAVGVVIGTLCVLACMRRSLNPVQVRAGQDAVNTYKLAENWAQLPPGRQWGQMSAVGLDAKGNVYAFERAEPSSIMVFNAQGKYLKSFGDESMTYAHGLSVASDGSIWATDRKVQQAFKFDPNLQAPCSPSARRTSPAITPHRIPSTASVTSRLRPTAISLPPTARAQTPAS